MTYYTYKVRERGKRKDTLTGGGSARDAVSALAYFYGSFLQTCPDLEARGGFTLEVRSSDGRETLTFEKEVA